MWTGTFPQTAPAARRGDQFIQEVGHDLEERRIQRLNLKVQLSTGQGWLGDRWYPREKVVPYNIRETQDDSFCDDYTSYKLI